MCSASSSGSELFYVWLFPFTEGERNNKASLCSHDYLAWKYCACADSGTCMQWTGDMHGVFFCVSLLFSLLRGYCCTLTIDPHMHAHVTNQRACARQHMEVSAAHTSISNTHDACQFYAPAADTLMFTHWLVLLSIHYHLVIGSSAGWLLRPSCSKAAKIVRPYLSLK